MMLMLMVLILMLKDNGVNVKGVVDVNVKGW